VTSSFQFHAGLSTSCEATHSRAAADLSKPAKPRGRPRKDLASAEPSGSSTQPASIHYPPPSKKGNRDPLREVIAIKPHLQPAAQDVPAPPDAIPASIHARTIAAKPAATASAHAAVITAAPWEMMAQDAAVAPSPALRMHEGNNSGSRHTSKTSKTSSSSSSSSSGVQALAAKGS